MSRYEDDGAVGVDGLAYQGDEDTLYMYPPFKLLTAAVKRYACDSRSIIYVHHEFDGPNHHSVILRRYFTHKILIGTRRVPACLTPAKKRGALGYYRPYSEPKRTYLYFRNIPCLKLQLLSRYLLRSRGFSLNCIFRRWVSSIRPKLYSVTAV